MLLFTTFCGNSIIKFKFLGVLCAPIIRLVFGISHYWPLFLVSILVISENVTDIVTSVLIMSFFVIITSLIVFMIPIIIEKMLIFIEIRNQKASIPHYTTDHLLIPQYTTDHLLIPQYTTDHLLIPQYTTDHLLIPQYTTDHLLIPQYTTDPVSLIMASTVLNIVEDEGLQENARIVGEYLMSRLKGLMDKHQCIGDVRYVSEDYS